MKPIQSLRKPFLKLVSPMHRDMYASHRMWRRDRAEIRRYDYPWLTAHSTVIDLGGYRGEWADKIFVRYLPTIHIFEPHPRFAKELMAKYAQNPKIHVHPCALASKDESFQLSDLGDASSAWSVNGAGHRCHSVEAGAYLRNLGVNAVDLIKINIEGGEYDILPHLGRLGLLSQIRALQVQFHLFSSQSIADREAIRDTLRHSHQESWCYPFVWEQWERKATP